MATSPTLNSHLLYRIAQLAMSLLHNSQATRRIEGYDSEIPIVVLENLAEAMFGLKGLSGSDDSGSDAGESESNSHDPDDYDDLDYTDFNWTGGRYDYQEQKDFIKKIVLKSSGYTHDPMKTPKERYEERKRILNDRNTQHRRIFCHWPSSDKIMPPLDSSGKPTGGFHPPLHNPKGLAPPNAPSLWNGPGIWGATLFDFYNISCLHPGLSWQTSGSKMLEWCLKNGDSSAAPQMAWAMTEPDPELIEPCDIGKLIETFESRMRMFDGMTSSLPSVEPTPILQQYFPQHLLPTTLVVHDPGQLLYTSGEKGTLVEHRYKLQVSAKYDKRRKEDEAREAQAAAEQKKVYETFLANPHTRNKLPAGRLLNLVPENDEANEGPTHQQLFYLNRLRPPRAPIQDAHLCLSEDQFLGVVNHSFVYDVRFVLPRMTFFEPQLCGGCIEEDIHTQISKYSFSPSFFTDMVGRMVFKDEFDPPKPHSTLTPAPPPQLQRVLSYEGPLIVLQSTVEYSHIPCAKHQSHARPQQARTEVRVVAKLSIKNDAHLAREAENYQRFPKYLFEQWSGLIKVSGIRNPVPAGPVVPQFYGYYVPEGETEDTHDDKGESDGINASQDNLEAKKKVKGEQSAAACPFLSPILLIENCGTPIDPKDLGFDDTQECCSLVFRLRDAGFFHASVANRNILAQNGPLSAWPVERNVFPGGYANRDSDGGPSGKCFRLIDFGRTEHRDALDEIKQRELMFQDHKTLLQWSDEREVLNQRW